MKQIPIPAFEDNKETYRNFITRHIDQLYKGGEIIRDTDCLLDNITNGKIYGTPKDEIIPLEDITYGYFGHLTETVWYTLKKLGIETEFIPCGEEEWGLSIEGQTEDLLEVPDEYLDNPLIKQLEAGLLDW